MTKDERRAYYQAWRAKHPDYHRAWREKYRITGDTEKPQQQPSALAGALTTKEPACPLIKDHVNR